MARNSAAFARVDTKNMAGRTQSLGALVVAAAVSVVSATMLPALDPDRYLAAC